jgi:hypothetical protein
VRPGGMCGATLGVCSPVSSHNYVANQGAQTAG